MSQDLWSRAAQIVDKKLFYSIHITRCYLGSSKISICLLGPVSVLPHDFVHLHGVERSKYGVLQGRAACVSPAYL